MSIPRVVLSALLLAGCATADRVQQLEERVTALEAKADTQAKAAPGKAATAADPEKEAKAKELYDAVADAVSKGDTKTAKAKLAELDSTYAGTTAHKRAAKMRAELEVVGKKAPADWNGNIEQWFQGEGEADITKGVALLVFWEVWCPHCRREVPNVKETYTKFHGKGLQVIGLTKVTRSSTEEKVTEFIKENEINYPIAKEDGKLSKYFGVSGIPAAAVIKDGEVVWRGHPGRLNDDLINSWL